VVKFARGLRAQQKIFVDEGHRFQHLKSAGGAFQSSRLFRDDALIRVIISLTHQALLC
jgi:hypothetical protein